MTSSCLSPKKNKKSTKSLTYSKEESFKKLMEIQELALSMEPKPDFTAALRSEELKGKLFALYDKKEDRPSASETLTLTPSALVTFVDVVDEKQMTE